MSTLTVTLTEPVETVAADPAGFGDGLAAGWNGLVATLNGIVIALGFLIPWILVVGVIALVVWAIVTLVRRRRTNQTSVSSTEGSASDSSS
jgi:predicted lipid-binding transport protein (Tim44 family)